MITIFTTSHCPRCQLLKMKLDQLNIPYEVFDDEYKMLDMGIQSVPMMSVDGKLMDFADALKYLNER